MLLVFDIFVFKYFFDFLKKNKFYIFYHLILIFLS
nr:MAG TPA: hypothetical protein [Caudoviricetes sp.]